ncbi:hypothetical protein [Pseudofrankia sp. BMG5.36]|uniref:hypothetical protein n=1 Tax=Pseudofrankia sp. BMG5.36 TaxID=1834512 RepID=UPI001F52681C|nr:hypothetical protein [Pseudofrankia sp. BMG5.36]
MGKKAIRGVVDHPDLELVGLYVHSPDKEGKDAGELAGIGPLGVLATRDIEDVLALRPDCVLYMQEGFDLDDMTRLLSSESTSSPHATSSSTPRRWIRPSGSVSSRHASRGSRRSMRPEAVLASVQPRCH